MLLINFPVCTRWAHTLKTLKELFLYFYAAGGLPVFTSTFVVIFMAHFPPR